MADDLSPAPTATQIERLKMLAGEGGWSQDPARLEPKLVEWRDRWMGETPLLLLPRTAKEVAALVGYCAEETIPIIPQGGNTGLVGGQIPQGEVLLSTERMRAIRDVDPVDDVIVAEAGVTLVEVQEAAARAGRFFPLSLASEGSATIGGLCSTNAGGTAVLRYGTMRSLVLGIEAVLPNGAVIDSLKRLRKDNTGYDLKHLLIGAEGTLGVITAVALKLFPVLGSRAVAFVGLDSPADALKLLTLAKAESGGAVEAFELMARLGIEVTTRNIAGMREPLEGPHPWYVLTELASAEPGHAEAALERILEKAFEAGLVRDAAIAQNETQAAAFWALRENHSAAQKPEGKSWKQDVSVPVSKVPEFLERATVAVQGFSPGVRVMAFGHVGDGNIHFNVMQPNQGDFAALGQRHNALRDQGAQVVHDIVDALGGSISAEHGLGAMKSAEALRYKSAAEVEAMRAIRAALDPKRIMNPRVLF
jgi:FAD/FMN-containing dehydrogenase